MIASQKGTTNRTTTIRVIRATARPRLPPTIRCRRNSKGHTATTMVVAQIVAGRKGRNTQREHSVSPPMKNSSISSRVGSGR